MPNHRLQVGVYYTEGESINLPGIFHGPFYRCVGDEDMLEMSCTLYKHGKKLFTRTDRHWSLPALFWEFSEPTDLTMDVSITCKDETMLTAFVEGLRSVGYQEDEIKTSASRSIWCWLNHVQRSHPRAQRKLNALYSGRINCSAMSIKGLPKI